MGKKQKQTLPTRLKDDRILDYINKCVDLNYHAVKLKFYLSHGLFSSHDIDTGTILLLKTLAQNADFPAAASVLDMGCGTGVIGLSLKKRHPHLQILCTDRDALALAFTEENAALNQIEGIRTAGCLGIETGTEKFDLIVTNIPAKMGAPVMEDITARCLAALSPNGVFACVVISAFKDLIRGAAVKNNGMAMLTEETPRHTVYHFKAGPAPAPVDDPFTPYERSNLPFSYKGTQYRLTTALNLPDFDTIGYATKLALALLKGVETGRRTLVINPGQGHAPCYLAARSARAIEHITLTGRDLLQLTASRRNLVKAGWPADGLEAVHSAFLSCCKGPFDLIMIFPEVVPGVHWEKEIAEEIRGLCAKQARIIVSSKSTYIQRLLDAHTGLSLLRKVRDKGFSAAIMRLK